MAKENIIQDTWCDIFWYRPVSHDSQRSAIKMNWIRLRSLVCVASIMLSRIKNVRIRCTNSK